MLLLSIPVTGVVSIAAESDGPVVALNDDFSKTEVNWGSNSEIAKKGERITDPVTGNKYYVLHPSSSGKIQGVISNGSGGYTKVDAYNGYFKTVTYLETAFSASSKLAQMQNKDSFTVELALPKIETEFVTRARIRLRYFNSINASGATSGNTAASDLITIDKNGTVSLKTDSSVLLGNVKDEALSISLTAVYNASKKAYIVTALVNGTVKTATATITNFHGSSLSAQTYYNSTSIGFNSINFNGYDDTYGVSYTDSGTTVTVDGKEEKLYTVASQGNTSSIYDENGSCLYSFALDHVRVTFGDNEMTLSGNDDKILLYADGYTEMPGATGGSNCFSITADAGETTALPEDIDWYTAENVRISAVPSALAGTGVIAAYATPRDRQLYGCDFNNGTAGLGKLEHMTHDAVQGNLLLEGNYYIDKDHTNTQLDENGDRLLDASYGNRPYGYDKNVYCYPSLVTATPISFTMQITLIHDGTEKLPTVLWRLRKSDRKNDINLLSLESNGDIVFLNGTSTKLLPDSSVQMTFHVTMSNRYEDGVIVGSKVTVTTYANGVCYGTHTVNSLITIGTGLTTDFSTVQLHHNKYIISDEVTRVRIDDLSISIDNAGDDAEEYAFSPYNGASIRPATDTASSGLRFGYRVDKAWFDQLTAGASSVEVGAYIIPEDYLVNGKLDAETIAALSADKELLRMTVYGWNASSDVSNESTYGFYASIVDLKDHNYAREFRSIAYITVDGVTYYSTASESRSVNEVARRMAASGDLDGKYADMKDLITDTYLDTVVQLDASCSLINTEGYTPPYEITKSGSDLLLIKITAIDGFDMDNVKSIVIDGKHYNIADCSVAVDPVSGIAFEISFTYTLPTA